MRITSGISTAALMAWMLVGLSSPGQEPVAPTNTPAGDSASATDTTTDNASSQHPAPATSHSKIRIVRLSEVKGEVQLDRQTGKVSHSIRTRFPARPTEADFGATMALHSTAAEEFVTMRMPSVCGRARSGGVGDVFDAR